MKYFFRVLACAILTVSAYGQSNSGNIQGSVTDPSGAAVAGAKVTAQNLDTGVIAASSSTTNAGLYSLPNLPPGRYAITVEAVNLKKFTQEGVTVATGTTVSLDVQMQLGAVTENVTVTSDASQLETATSDIGATVESSLITNLPLSFGGTVRNPMEFVKLVPGFVGGLDNNPGSNSSDDFKVNGGQEGGTDVLVDGVSISLVSPNTQWNKGVSSDAVQEFKVLQSNFSPEFGESGDGIVSLTVKSGTNRLHASAYDYLRNRAFDANSWKNNLLGVPRSVNTQNDFGFTAGGPVYVPHLYNGKDKTFFFVAYEGFRLRNGGNNTLSLPNEAFRAGDFSADCTGGFTGGICNDRTAGNAVTHQLYDPTSGAAIPGNLLTNDPNFTPSTVMTKVFALLPGTNGSLNNNVTDRSISKTTANLIDIKIDHALSDKHRISGGFDYDNTKTGGVSSLSNIFGSSTPQNTRYARFSDNYIFSPTLVNQFLFGFSRRFRGEVANSLGQGYPAKIGLTGVNNNTFPCIKWFGSPYEVNNCGDSEFADNVYQLNDSVNWVKGKHNFKFGGGYRFLQFNVRRLTTAAGEFDFDPAQTSNGGVGNGDPVASSLFGLVNQGVLNYGGFSGVRYKDYSFFAQDSYKLTPRLTVNYGLRYDIDLPASEAFNRFSAVDPKLPNPGAGNILGAYTYFGTGTGRNGRTRPQDTYKKAFGPRLGFAFSIDSKTVLRGGYGIFYEPLKEGSFADQDGLGFFNKETLTSASGPAFQIDNGFPHILPQFGPFTPEGQNGNSGVILVPRNSGRPADIQSWNLDVERQIAANLVLKVAYVGSKGTHLPALNIIPNQVNPSFLSLGSDLNVDSSCLSGAPPPAPQCPTAIAAGIKLPYATFTGKLNQLLRPFPQYGQFNQEDNSFTPDRSGNSTYHAMQAGLEKRFAQGLSFLVSYTISKNITDADSAGPGVSGFIGTNSFIGQNSYNRRAEKAVSQLDTPQSLVASFFYELPLGRGKRYLSEGGVADRLAGGWYVSAIASYHSGTPTTVYGNCGGTAGDVLFGGCSQTGIARVNVVPGVSQVNKRDLNPATTPFWNPTAFTLPAQFTFGNEPRSLAGARAFGGRNEDFTVGKKIHLVGETATLDFRAEFFNVFNRHIFSAPGGFSTPLGNPFIPAGAPGCSGPLACGFGAITDSSGPRIIQFGLKITY